MKGWRAFPWDPRAPGGEPYSPTFVPEPTGRGRFDLPSRLTKVLYLAESPAHAVAELLHPWRGRRIDARHLDRAGHTLALVEMRWSGVDAPVDLCDPASLVALAVAPDLIASRHRAVTQPIARSIWAQGAPGLRWWSRFFGDWHTSVLFTARIPTDLLDPGEPEPLTVESPALAEAAGALGIEVGR